MMVGARGKSHLIHWAHTLVRPLFALKSLDPLEARHLSQQDISALKSLGIFLGTYRNLTTLTAGMLSLHPHCQVLNHAGLRILGRKDINFLRDYSESRFEKFCRFALLASQGGMRGPYGGSITHSHAFDREHMRERYEDRFGQATIKERVESIVWKEPFFVGQTIRRHNIDLGAIFAENRALRFIMPVRSPLDCAVSNERIGYGAFMKDHDASDHFSMLDAVLNEFHWFLHLQRQNPERFFYFLQDDFDRAVAAKLAQFLELEPAANWLDDVETIYRLRSAYPHSPAIKEYYQKRVNKRFEEFPLVRERLMEFVLNG